MWVRWNELARFALCGRSGRSADVDVDGGKWMWPLWVDGSDEAGRAMSSARRGVESGEDKLDLSTGRDSEGDVAIGQGPGR